MVYIHIFLYTPIFGCSYGTCMVNIPYMDPMGLFRIILKLFTFFFLLEMILVPNSWFNTGGTNGQISQ